MTRKKINPQAVVTVQRSLPRVAISIILIFFSYAIGSLLVRLVYPLTITGPQIVWQSVEGVIYLPHADFTDMVINNPNEFSTWGWTILAIAANFTWADIGIGMSMLVFLIFIILTLIIVGFIALIKTLIIYLKLITYIIVAPLYFALAVIPGKENMILDWFKEMAIGILSIAAMLFTIHVALAVPFFSIGSTGSIACRSSADIGFVNATVTALLVPLLMLFLLGATIKMPKKIETWIKGDRRR